MINLPKPSLLSMRGKEGEQLQYLQKYLSNLVASLENILSGIKTKTSVSEKPNLTDISYSNDGVVILRNDGSEQKILSNNVLWGDSNTWSQMETGMPIYLSKNISEQTQGIVLVFSAYSNGIQDGNFDVFFVPKRMVAAHPGKSYNFMLGVSDFSYVGNKVLYIYDDYITGHSTNDDTGTASGITYNNAHWVLRYVIGL